MPLFDFRCRSCGRKFTALVGVLADSDPPSCPGCGGGDLTKLVSRFSTARSEEKLLDDLSDPSRIGDLEDPASMRRLVKEMGKELDEDLGDELEDYMAEAGDEDAADDETIY